MVSFGKEGEKNMDNSIDKTEENQEMDNLASAFEAEIKQSYKDLSDKLPLPPTNAFSRVMDTIKAEERKEERKERYSANQSISIRFFQSMRDWLAVPKLGWAVAGVQFAVILFLFLSPLVSDRTTFQTLSIDTAPGISVEINIVFKENAVQRDIRQLLNNTEAVIINGPTESGLYILKVKQGHDLSIRLQAIGNSKIVKFVSKRY